MFACDATQYHEGDVKMQPFGNSGEGFVGLFEGFVVVFAAVAVVVVVIVGVMAFLAPAFLKQYQKTTHLVNHLVPSN